MSNQIINEVIQRITVEPPKGDGFKKLGEQAKTASDVVRQRLDDMQRKLNEVGNVRGAMKDPFEKMFGFSKLDENMGRMGQRITDRMADIREKMARGADPAVLLKSIHRAGSDVEGLKNRVEGLAEASMSSFGRAAAGATTFARGVALLASGDDDLAKLVQRMAQLQGVIDLMRGGGAVLQGVAAGITNLVKAQAAASMAGAMAGELGGVAAAAGARQVAAKGMGMGGHVLTASVLGATGGAANAGINAAAARAAAARGAVPAAQGGAAAGAAGGGGGFMSGLATFGIPAAALALTAGGLVAGLAPDWTARMLGMGDNEGDAMLGRMQARRQQFFGAQQRFAADAALRNPAEAQQRGLVNLQEMVQLRGRMIGGKPEDIGMAEANLGRQQAVQRVLDLERQIKATTDQDAAKRMNLFTQLVDAQQQLLDAEQKKITAIEAQGRAARERMEAEKQHAAAQRQHQEGLLQSERDRLNSAKENFGLMDPMKQMAVKDITRKLQAGQNLTEEEIGIAQGNELLRDGLARQGRRRADELGIFEQVADMPGRGDFVRPNDRMEEAARLAQHFENVEVKIKQEILLNVKQDEAAQQAIVNALVPELVKMRQQIEQKLRQEFRMADLAAAAQPGPG